MTKIPEINISDLRSKIDAAEKAGHNVGQLRQLLDWQPGGGNGAGNIGDQLAAKVLQGGGLDGLLKGDTSGLLQTVTAQLLPQILGGGNKPNPHQEKMNQLQEKLLEEALHRRKERQLPKRLKRRLGIKPQQKPVQPPPQKPAAAGERQTLWTRVYDGALETTGEPQEIVTREVEQGTNKLAVDVGELAIAAYGPEGEVWSARGGWGAHFVNKAWRAGGGLHPSFANDAPAVTFSVYSDGRTYKLRLTAPKGWVLHFSAAVWRSFRLE